jgi:hypothetical protein
MTIEDPLGDLFAKLFEKDLKSRQDHRIGTDFLPGPDGRAK